MPRLRFVLFGFPFVSRNRNIAAPRIRTCVFFLFVGEKNKEKLISF